MITGNLSIIKTFRGVLTVVFSFVILRIKDIVSCLKMKEYTG